MKTFKEQANELIKERHDLQLVLTEEQLLFDTKYISTLQQIKTLIEAGEHFIDVLQRWAFDDNPHGAEIYESITKLRETIK